MSKEQPISALLRAVGKTIADVGKRIEDSQIEDGDPPFGIGEEFITLQKAVKSVEKAMKSLTAEEPS